jgi:hypothetical protein
MVRCHFRVSKKLSARGRGAWLWLEAPALACGDVAALMAGSEVAAAVGVVVVEVPGGGVDGLAAPHAHRLPGGDEGCEAGSEFLVRRAVAAGRG